MKILAIETSCDETAIAIIEYEGDPRTSPLYVLSNVVLSQIDLHKEYGGVYPSLAKREHAKNLVPVLDEALTKACLKKDVSSLPSYNKEELKTLLEREPDLFNQCNDYIPKIKIPEIDALAVTAEPGLEPALWVGINFAKALALTWGKPLLPINHMEGHIYSALLHNTETEEKKYTLSSVTFPVLALLISGGHTELVLMRDWLSYEVIGETKDDAVGEAFDKTARMLDLPYPGGPEISKLAKRYGEKREAKKTITLPRPMIDSGDYNFSFSGLKTAVKNTLHSFPKITPEIKEEMAYEFQEAATEVLVEKTAQAIEAYGVKTLIAGGGVSANERIREALIRRLTKERVALFLPPAFLTTDNALMIALAAALREAEGKNKHIPPERFSEIRAHGTARLGSSV